MDLPGVDTPQNEQYTASRATAVIVQQGKLLDYIDGITQRDETPEEYVRQEIAKSLVREYGYSKSEVAVEFVIRLGSRKPRADLVVFEENAPRQQDKARIVIECKSQKVKANDKKDGVEQLKSYMAVCPKCPSEDFVNLENRLAFLGLRDWTRL